MTQVLGGLILLVVFGGIFFVTVRDDGWREAILAWAFAIGLTACIIVGFALVLGGVS